MALAAKPLSFLLHRKSQNRTKASSILPFESRLSHRLKSLLPIPQSSPSIPLSWFSQAVDLLSQTLADASTVFSDQSLSSHQSPISSLLSSTTLLLDACNSITSATDSALSRRLVLLLALSHLSSPNEKSAGRAKALLTEWKFDISPRASHHLMALDPPPRGSLSSVRRAVYAVEAVSYLVVASLSSVFGSDENRESGRLAAVSGEFVWSAAFNEVGAAVWGRVGDGFPGEVAAVAESVGKLGEAIGELKEGDDGGRMMNAVMAVERDGEELAEALSCLYNAVRRLFDSTLVVRDAAMQSLRARSQHCE